MEQVGGAIRSEAGRHKSSMMDEEVEEEEDNEEKDSFVRMSQHVLSLVDVENCFMRKE